MPRNLQINPFGKRIFQWSTSDWMVDDIQLTEAFDSDILAYQLSSHKETGNQFGTQDKISFKIVNLSAKDITSNFSCFLQVDQRPPIETVVKASKKDPFQIIDTLDVSFPWIDLTDYGIQRSSFIRASPEI